MYPQEKITIIFQPHLYSRTKDFSKEFGEVLGTADEVILLPIYPARELPMEGVSSALIQNQLQNVENSIVEKNELLEKLDSFNNGVLVISGAGDIDTLIPEIKQKFS